jgi:hypothetical protein
MKLFSIYVRRPYLLQTRTAALNNDLPDYFERWYSGLKINSDTEQPFKGLKEAA